MCLQNLRKTDGYSQIGVQRKHNASSAGVELESTPSEDSAGSAGNARLMRKPIHNTTQLPIHTQCRALRRSVN